MKNVLQHFTNIRPKMDRSIHGTGCVSRANYYRQQTDTAEAP